MPKAERLSAVAKRRRLNGSALRDGDSGNTSRSQSPAKLQIQTEVLVSHNQGIVPPGNEISQEANEFGALVAEELVQFSGFREIERVNHQTIKIRLSKEQRCFISGRYSLWIKDGIISFQGARLEASFDMHNIYSSCLIEVPAILALTHTVELEIRTHHDVVPDCLGFGFYQWVSPTNESFSVSFFVHGHSISVDGSGPNLNKGEDTSIAKEFSQRICEFDNSDTKQSTPTVLACGKQFIGTTTPFVCLLNGIITAKYRRRTQPSGQGILLLDLDSKLPILATPGTSSLVYMTKPVFGSSFTQPATTWSMDYADPFTVISIQYESGTDHPAQHVTRLGQYLELVKNFRMQGHQDCPLIVRANDWLELFDASQVEHLTRKILPTFVVCHGPESASYSGQLGGMIARQSNASPVTIMPVKAAFTTVTSELVLQSYFRFRGYEHGYPRWSCLPLELESTNQIYLAYASDFDLLGAISIPGMHLGSVDMKEVLNGCIVGVVLHAKTEASRNDKQVSQRLQNHQDLTSKPKANDYFESSCLGFGIVTGFAKNSKGICLSTPIPQHVLDDHIQQGKTVELVFPKADPDSGFDTAWVQLELGASSSGTRLGKTIYRRKLNVQPERRAAVAR